MADKQDFRFDLQRIWNNFLLVFVYRIPSRRVVVFSAGLLTVLGLGYLCHRKKANRISWLLSWSPWINWINRAKHKRQKWKDGRSKFNKAPRGLVNLGNTCYMNSLLQVLCWTPQMGQQLASQLDEQTDAGTDSVGTCLLELIDDVHSNGNTDSPHFKEPEISHMHHLNGQKILGKVRQLNTQFLGNEQQDSFELFNTIMGGLEDEAEEQRNGEEEKEFFVNQLPVNKLLGGMFMTVYQYQTCGHIELTFQRFTSISVPVPRPVLQAKHHQRWQSFEILQNSHMKDNLTETDSDLDENKVIPVSENLNKDTEKVGITDFKEPVTINENKRDGLANDENEIHKIGIDVDTCKARTPFDSEHGMHTQENNEIMDKADVDKQFRSQEGEWIQINREDVDGTNQSVDTQTKNDCHQVIYLHKSNKEIENNTFEARETRDQLKVKSNLPWNTETKSSPEREIEIETKNKIEEISGYGNEREEYNETNTEDEKDRETSDEDYFQDCDSSNKADDSDDDYNNNFDLHCVSAEDELNTEQSDVSNQHVARQVSDSEFVNNFDQQITVPSEINVILHKDDDSVNQLENSFVGNTDVGSEDNGKSEKYQLLQNTKCKTELMKLQTEVEFVNTFDAGSKSTSGAIAHVADPVNDGDKQSPIYPQIIETKYVAGQQNMTINETESNSFDIERKLSGIGGKLLGNGFQNSSLMDQIPTFNKLTGNQEIQSDDDDEEDDVEEDCDEPDSNERFPGNLQESSRTIEPNIRSSPDLRNQNGFAKDSSAPSPSVVSEVSKETCFQSLKYSTEEGMTDLERGLMEITEIELFDEKEVGCRKCHIEGDRKTQKKLSIISVPPILVLQINKFQQSGGKLHKIQQNVSYPKHLNLAPVCSKAILMKDLRCTTSNDGICYHLYGVVSHVGTLKSGHYTAFIRTNQQPEKIQETFLKKEWIDPESCRDHIETFLKENTMPNQHLIPTQEVNANDTWYHISDTSVKLCSEEQAIQDSNASILFYERIV